MIWWISTRADVRLVPQRRVAHDVEVGEAGDAERLREAAADGHLAVEDDLGGAVRLVGEEDGEEAGHGGFGARRQAVVTGVGR